MIRFINPLLTLFLYIQILAYQTGTGTGTYNNVSFSEISSIAKELKFDTIAPFFNHSHDTSGVTDTLKEQIKTHCFQWQREVTFCLSLVYVALGNGFTVNSQELDSVKSYYTLAFPDISFDNGKIKNEILLRKYIHKKTAIAPTDLQIEHYYKKYLAETPLSSPPSQESIKPLLYNKVMLSHDRVKQICKEESAKAQKKLRERVAKVNLKWPVEVLSINADPQQCLVANLQNESCIINVGHFNSYLPLKPISTRIRPDSARNWILASLINNSFYFLKTKNTNLSNDEQLIEERKQRVEESLLNVTYTDLRKNIENKQLLIYTYRKYFERFFNSKTISNIGLIGSTDSMFIDSLYQGIRRFSPINSLSKASQKRKYIYSLPWIFTSSEELPDSMVCYINTHKSSKCTTITTPYGYFLYRKISKRHRSKTQFEEAAKKLIYLIRKDNEIFKGRTDSAVALEYYKKNINKFKTCDTLELQAWLCPVIDTNAFNEMDKAARIKFISKDTSSFSNKKVHSTLLPAEVSLKVLHRFKELKDKKNIIGPITDIFGTWYFHVKKLIPGGKNIPFEKTKEKILTDLEVKCFPLEQISQTKDGTEIIQQKIMKDIYSNSLNDNFQSIPDNYIKKLFDDKIIAIPENITIKYTPLLFHMVRKKLLDKKLQKDHMELNSFYKTLNIDSELLFKGLSDSKQNLASELFLNDNNRKK